MSFDPDAYLAQPPAPTTEPFDPDKYLGQSFDPDAYLAQTTGTAESYANQAQRGLVSEGIWQRAQGLAELPRTAATTLGEAVKLALQRPEEIPAAGESFEAYKRRQTAQTSGRAAIDTQIRAGIDAHPAVQAGDWLAGAYQQSRDAYRRTHPVRPDVEQSRTGQLVAGAAGLAGDLPFYLNPVTAATAAPALAAGGIHQEALDDARQTGANEEQARITAAAYLPAAALDYLPTEKLVRRVLTPLIGKVTLRQAVGHVLAQAGLEGSTESAQQAWLNQLAQAGYDPDRELSQGLVDSLLVGGALGGTATAGGIATGEGARRIAERRDQQAAASLARWAQALGATAAERNPVAVDGPAPDPRQAQAAAATAALQRSIAASDAQNSPQGVVETNTPVGAQAPAGSPAEIEEILAAEKALADAQRAETERRTRMAALQARDFTDLVGEALRPRVAALAGQTELQRHDFWQGMQGLAQSLAGLQTTTADGKQARSRQLGLAEMREQAALVFDGAAPELLDAIALKLHGAKPAESVAALRDLHRYAGTQRAQYAGAAQVRTEAEAERRRALQEEMQRADTEAKAEARRVAKERARIRDTGRDLAGKVADWTAVPDEELGTIAASTEADGVDPDEISGAQAELERRGREEGQQRPLSREDQIRLIERYGGINPAHAVHAGEIATLRESDIGKNRKLWREDGNSLDTLAQQIRQDVQNGPQDEAEVLEWLGELAAGRTPKLYERGDMGAEYARPLPPATRFSVQRPQPHPAAPDRTIPGFNQVDFFEGDQNTRSATMDELRAEDYEVPDIPDAMPTGQYSEDQVRGRARWAAARRAEPFTKGITPEQLATPVQPVEAPAGEWTTDNHANNRRLRQNLAPLVGQTIAGVQITSGGLKHSARLLATPEEFRMASQLGELLRTSVPVGKSEAGDEAGVQLERRLAVARIDGRPMPVRFTIRRQGSSTTLYHFENAERHSGVSLRPSAERTSSRSGNGVQHTVADILPEVKPQPNGTYTARFARAGMDQETAEVTPAVRKRIANLERRFRRMFPALFAAIDVQIADVQATLRASGENPPEGVEAAYLPRLRAEKDLIVLGIEAALRNDGQTGLSRLLHESAHAYWRMLSPETREALRGLYERDLQEQWSPLWKDGEIATEVSQQDILSGDELGLEEWFSELMAATNAEWAGRRYRYAGTPGWVLDLAHRLREILAGLWRRVADHKGLQGAARQAFLIDDFRAFLTRGFSAQRTAAAGAAFARHAQAQALLGLDTAMGIDLPAEIAGLVPNWQDRKLRFQSRLDKALYYVGAPGNTELRDRLVASLQEQTGLTEGQIRSLARSVRDRLPALVRSQPQEGSVRVPEIAPALAEQMSGVRYAQGQPARTDTPEFRAWFGQSKVVDAAGKPLLVYHGSPDARFADQDGIFKSLKERHGMGSGGGAHWFTTSIRTAKSYADPRRAFDYQAAKEGVVSAYIKIENPLEIDAAGTHWREAQRRGKTSDVIAEAQQAGHDGVIIRNVRDDYNNTPSTKPTDTFVVWKSEQIKTPDNRGTWSAADPRIRFAQAQDHEANAPAPRERFEAADAKVRDLEAQLAALADSQADDVEAQGAALKRQLAEARRERNRAAAAAMTARSLVESDPVSKAMTADPTVRSLRDEKIKLAGELEQAKKAGQPTEALLDRRDGIDADLEAIRRQAEKGTFPPPQAEIPLEFGDTNPPRNDNPPKTAKGDEDPDHLRPMRILSWEPFTDQQLTERLARLKQLQAAIGGDDLEQGARLSFLANLVRDTREELDSRRAALESQAERDAIGEAKPVPEALAAREDEELAREQAQAAQATLDAEAAAAIPDVPAEQYPIRENVEQVAAEVSAATVENRSGLAGWLDKVRKLLAGFRSAVPELPTFKGASRFATFREGLRLLHGLDEVVRRDAEESVADIVAPLREHSTPEARTQQVRLSDLQRKRAQYQEKLAAATAEKNTEAAQRIQRRLAAIATEFSALQKTLADDPWVVFQNVILYGDLFTRSRLYRRDDGSPISLPGGLNPAEAEHLFKLWLQRAHAHPQSAAILQARERHKAFVAQLADQLKVRGFVFAEGANTNYFPHVMLEQWDGAIERVKAGTAKDFRGYLITPTGSQKPIETDYLKAMYYHAVQVMAHNRRADILRDYVAREDIRQQLVDEAAEANKARRDPDAPPFTWRDIYHMRYTGEYELYSPDPDEIPLHPELVIDRDALAKRLGVVLGAGPLQQELKKAGLADLPLAASEIQVMLVTGSKELWVLPKDVAAALRGISRRAKKTDILVTKTLATAQGIWKKNILFAPWNWLRFEFNNLVSDSEKILTADPAMARGLIAAGRDVYAFITGDENASDDVRLAFRLGVLDTLTAAEVNALRAQRPFQAWETTGDAAKRATVNRLTSYFSSSHWNTMGWSKLREATFRFAKFKADLERMRNGATPRYAGAYWRNVEALERVGAPEAIRETNRLGRLIGRQGPGTGPQASQKPYALAWEQGGRRFEETYATKDERAKKRAALEEAQRQADTELVARKAAAISRATFGDYGELTPNGNGLRRLFIPFYAWTEVNFRYHANLLRNVRDQFVGGEISTGAAAGRAAAQIGLGGARAGMGVLLRLALPYIAVQLWNGLAHGDEEDDLSEEDRRRFHLILGRAADGSVQVVYLPTAFSDLLKWFGGNRAAQLVTDVATHKTDWRTAAGDFGASIVPDFLNNTIGSAGPVWKIPYTLASGKSTFPDITDQRTIPSYDMRRVILGQMSDQMTAEMIEAAINKDYVASRTVGSWAKQAILQVRRRDPEQWAFYAVKDKAAAFEERKTGKTEGRATYDAPDAQVLRQFRRAIYQADVPTAMRMYQRLLELGYTAERFESSVRAQDPLYGLPREMRREFMSGLNDYEREQVRTAYRYYLRMQEMEGAGRRLFPRRDLPERARERWLQRDRSGVLDTEIQRAVATQEDDATAERKIDRELRDALRRR